VTTRKFYGGKKMNLIQIPPKYYPIEFIFDSRQRAIFSSRDPDENGILVPIGTPVQLHYRDPYPTVCMVRESSYEETARLFFQRAQYEVQRWEKARDTASFYISFANGGEEEIWDWMILFAEQTAKSLPEIPFHLERTRSVYYVKDNEKDEVVQFARYETHPTPEQAAELRSHAEKIRAAWEEAKKDVARWAERFVHFTAPFQGVVKAIKTNVRDRVEYQYLFIRPQGEAFQRTGGKDVYARMRAYAHHTPVDGKLPELVVGEAHT